MSKVLKALFSPTVLIIIAALLVAALLATCRILPRVQAAQVSCVDEETQCVAMCRMGINSDPVPVPEGYHANSDGFCVADPDVCPNLEGAQAEVPEGYHLDDKTGDCVQDGQV